MRANELSQRAWAGVRAHYSVARMADRALEVYRELARGAGTSERREGVVLGAGSA